ncbi:MAG TPA: tyrosine--tRNA ligase [Gemmatimonadaceae bacterium]|nr:tyrosine--tRNA ligase [Gemmatimonadaceae bacterium]
MPAANPLLDELRWRGMLHQHTDGLSDALSRGMVSGYCGFDPTAASLHVGNLVPVMGLVHLQRSGHRPVFLAGGGTGMIGDPSGKSTERPLLSLDEIAHNADRIRTQLERFVDATGKNAALVRNNADWLAPLKAIEFMRDVGKHFTVNYMTQKESVKTRLESGLSYTEFSYMLLQAYDYLKLYQRDGVALQVGGSDQWGNITAGIELIRRTEGAEAHALTFPLLTTASGAKFGKTEAGAVWLDPERTSPYRFYQYWINTDDRDVSQMLRIFTLLEQAVIEQLETAMRQHPEQREAQRALARDVTQRVHGESSLRAAEEVSQLLFGKGDPNALSADALHQLEHEIPVFDTATNSLGVAELITAVIEGKDALFKSRGEARRAIDQGGFYVNGERVASMDFELPRAKLLHGKYVLTRKGARSYGLVRVKTA